MPVPRLTAVTFHKMLESGRNRPAVFACVNSAGALAGDYVVKFAAGPQLGTSGSAREMIASLLAAHCGVLSPSPAIVTINPDLQRYMAAQRNPEWDVLCRSTRENFATAYLTDASTWPRGREIPDGMMPATATLFAFDALIDNVDRRRENPNILARGDEIFAIDHELAFSFVHELFAREAAWRVARRSWLRDHVFYFQLRKRDHDFSAFIRRVSDLNSERLEALVREVPDAWQDESIGKISDHLKDARDHAGEFRRQILEALA